MDVFSSWLDVGLGLVGGVLCVETICLGSLSDVLVCV